MAVTGYLIGTGKSSMYVIMVILRNVGAKWCLQCFCPTDHEIIPHVPEPLKWL